LCAKEIQDSVTKLKASIDGKNITNLDEYRVQSPLFNFTLPENNIVGLPPQNTQAVSDGNWVFLKPLSEGEHIISFKGGLKNISSVPENKNNSFSFAGPHGWDNKVTYHISIVGNNNPSSAANPTSKVQNLTDKENRGSSNLLNLLSQSIETSLKKAGSDDGNHK
jgi:hypothetical protein